MKIYADYSNRLDPDCYTRGRGGQPVLVLVCHNTAGPSDRNFAGQDAAMAQKLSDQAAAYLTSNDRQVSIHWLVGAEACGAPIYRIVPEENTAYHCGGNPPAYPSKWADPDSKQSFGGFGLNQVSIGIELFGQPGDTLGPNQAAALKALVQDIASRNTKLQNANRIVAHASLEGDRTDGKNWVAQAQGWVKEVGGGGGGVNLIAISYKVTIPAGKAVVRTGPGRNYPPVTNLDADPNKQYQVDGEAHGELIGTDDVWSHLPEVNGFVTRTALKIIQAITN
jgi:hypothetical protein